MLVRSISQQRGPTVNSRLFPSTHLHDWGLEQTDGRCPRCHVHRFDILIERADYDRLISRTSESAFASGHCSRCGLSESYLFYADGRVVTLV
jgi:hypothetical protein